MPTLNSLRQKLRLSQATAYRQGEGAVRTNPIARHQLAGTIIVVAVMLSYRAKIRGAGEASLAVLIKHRSNFRAGLWQQSGDFQTQIGWSYTI
ncbi:MAG: hypothetical protein RH948_19070, partial [Cyclobacteriaceae bacterium]